MRASCQHIGSTHTAGAASAYRAYPTSRRLASFLSPLAQPYRTHSHACFGPDGVSPRRTVTLLTATRRGRDTAKRSPRPRGSPWCSAQPPGGDSPLSGGPQGRPAPDAATGGPEIDRQAPVNSQQHVLVSGEVIEYKDSASDVLFIALVRKAYARIAGWQSERGWKDGPESYKGMVEVSKALMKGRSAEEQLSAVLTGFPAVPPLFRRLFPYSRWGAEVNAQITPAFFTWLVGPMERREVEIDGVSQMSSVHIKRCRYLAESNCAGMCINLCKSPTQAFFNEQLGMPLSMEPNFEDYSCDMVFGKAAMHATEDPAFQQPCLVLCTTAQAANQAAVADKRCYKLQ